ncbi:MAG: hypothetical protein ACI92A_000709, partial [Candidatus Paceibacteria bacterium]
FYPVSGGFYHLRVHRIPRFGPSGNLFTDRLVKVSLNLETAQDKCY